MTQIPPQTEPAEEKPIAFCFNCGTPLTAPQIELTIKGRWIKWNNRQEGDIVTNYCKRCSTNIDIFVKSGIDGAVKRKEEMDEFIRKKAFGDNADYT